MARESLAFLMGHEGFVRPMVRESPFGPVANRDAHVARMKVDLDDPASLRRHVRLVVDQMLAMMLR